jgi:hypothetical protein
MQKKLTFEVDLADILTNRKINIVRSKKNKDYFYASIPIPSTYIRKHNFKDDENVSVIILRDEEGETDGEN